MGPSLGCILTVGVLCAGTVNTITTKYQVCNRKSYTSPLLVFRKSAPWYLAQPLTAFMVVRRISQ